MLTMQMYGDILGYVEQALLHVLFVVYLILGQTIIVLHSNHKKHDKVMN